MKTSKQGTWVAVALVCVMAVGNVALADTFGVGANHFTIDFVSISGDASSANGTNISQYSSGDIGYKTFTDPGGNYRMGTYEITNDQWGKFTNELGVPVTGDPSNAYDEDPCWTGADIPANMLSWHEAAQFVNWLNTSTGHQPAYKFTGTQGTGDYALDIWSEAEAAGGTNRRRHKDAFYFLPTEDEWVKAAYWNGTTLRTYATMDDSVPVAGVESNYDQDSPYSGPWSAGSGSKELNGTFDMMGNLFERMESPWGDDPGFGSTASCTVRGGSYASFDYRLKSSSRYGSDLYFENANYGYRVAANIPEPCTTTLLALGGLALRGRRKG